MQFRVQALELASGPVQLRSLVPRLGEIKVAASQCTWMRMAMTKEA